MYCVYQWEASIFLSLSVSKKPASFIPLDVFAIPFNLEWNLRKQFKPVVNLQQIWKIIFYCCPWTSHCFLVPSPFLRKVIQFRTGPLNVLSWSLKRLIRIAAFVLWTRKSCKEKWCTGSVQVHAWYVSINALCPMELVELVYCWHRSPWTTLKHFCINNSICNSKSVLADAPRRLTVSWYNKSSLEGLCYCTTC